MGRDMMLVIKFSLSSCSFPLQCAFVAKLTLRLSASGLDIPTQFPVLVSLNTPTACVIIRVLRGKTR